MTEYYQNNSEQLNAMQKFFSEGMAKHLADLPFKFGLPLGLWVAFYLRELLPSND